MEEQAAASEMDEACMGSSQEQVVPVAAMDCVVEHVDGYDREIWQVVEAHS